MQGSTPARFDLLSNSRKCSKIAARLSFKEFDYSSKLILLIDFQKTNVVLGLF